MTHRRYDRGELSIVTLVILAAVLGCRAEKRPVWNVVFVSIDCLNQRQLSEALARGLMPAVGALARESTVFTRAYANAPWTTPSHMTMLSGLYPSQHGRDQPISLQDNINLYYDRVPRFLTIADYLAEHGFETAAFVTAGSMSAAFGLGQGFSTFHETPRPRRASDLPETERAIEGWLGARGARPFFLFVHTYELHDPRPAGVRTDDEALESVDRFIGWLVAQLRERGLYEQTVVILTGDHGSSMINTAGKCCMHGVGHYEENLRVPLILKRPDASAVGARNDLLVRHVDLLPTVLELVGVPLVGYHGPGRSILRPASEASDDDAFSYSEADAYCVPRQALVNRRFKYIYTPRDGQQALLQLLPGFIRACPHVCFDLPVEEFFDLEADPHEEHNLLSDPLNDEQAKWLERFRQEMARHRNLPRAYTMRVVNDGEVAPNRILDSTRRALKNLGYIE